MIERERPLLVQGGQLLVQPRVSSTAKSNLLLLFIQTFVFRMQSAYRDAAAIGGEAAEMIQGRMESAMQRYLTYKAALLEPSTIDSQTALMAATGSWLVRLVTGTEAIHIHTG